MAAANLNIVTALAILQNLGPANVLLGTLLSVLPLLVTLGWFGGAVVAVEGAGSTRRAATWVAVALLALSFFLVPWSGLLATLAAFLVGLWQRRRRRQHRSAGRQRLGVVAWGLRLLDGVLIVGAVYALLLIQPWLAPEMVTTASGETFVAFVLSDDHESAVLLRERDRHILYVKEQLESRAVCSAPVTLLDGSSPYQLLFPTSKYPKCPSE